MSERALRGSFLFTKTVLEYEHIINVTRTGSMQAIPASVVIVRVEMGWIAHVRYEDRLLDKDLASVARYMLDSKIDYLFQELMRDWR